ncbi:MAG: elongation factor P hydroxylase [Synergistaceae bacterium]|nr:elongation factor P hydroxylase [Synergistaceae bacterium]
MIADSGANIVFGGGEAFYSPSDDYIQMPPKTDFKSAEGYYSTILHELSHWTGGEKRLDRVQRCGRFSKDYAFEELIAEMGSLFVATSAGIPQSETEFQNHASYIDSWLGKLRSDNMYIFKAAAEASKAAGYLLSRAGIAGAGTADESQGDKTDNGAKNHSETEKLNESLQE